jgi:formate-nitrite transporter family protein
MSAEHRDNVPKSETLPDRPKSIEKPESGTRLSAAEIHDNILGPAEDEMSRAAMALLCSAFASGLIIGFSFLMGAFAQTLVSPQYARAAAGAVYPVGFVLVIFSRSELFTENTLEPVIPFLHRRDRETFWKMIRLWALLLAGNLIGTVVFAWVMVHAPLIADDAIRARMESIAMESTSSGFVLTLIRAVLAGWLVALLAWMLASTQDSVAHLCLIWLTTAPIALLSFHHSIVGSVEAFYRVFIGRAAAIGMIVNVITPAVIGNTIGGVVFVALLNYGQVHHERGS